MAVYTNISKEKIKEIIEKNYMNIKIVKVRKINSGSENSNYLIKGLKEKYILTIVEGLGLKEIIFNIKLVNFLYFNGLKTPQIKITKQNKYYFIYINKNCVLTSFLSGSSIRKSKKKNCFILGKTLGRIHCVTKKFYFKKTNHMGIKKLNIIFKEIKKYISEKERETIIKELKNIRKKEIELLKKDISVGACHCDIFKDNIFFKKNQISGIFDFYFSSTEFLLYDISIAIIEWCFNGKKLSKDNLRYFIKGYEKNRKIKKIELEEIKNFIKRISIRFMLTRIKNNNSKKKGYKKKKYEKYMNIINEIENNMLNIEYHQQN